MSNIKFKIAAKTNVGRVRTNNEDNFQAACDLTTAPMKWVNDAECDLGDKGALLVVADGMGGMNAGEVASEIAINTIREFFSPEKITNKVLESRVSIESFMKNSIIEADKTIKKIAKANPEHNGMGTTIVVAWLIDDALYVAWCGDSRAYIYNRITGLKQITKDHSFVQTLIDKGKISADDAFDYPDSNIVTRCLGDGNQKARPDTLPHSITVHNNDIILLCTDGLCGMIRDHEIEQVIAEHEDNMLDCCDKLIDAACEAAGEDNVTVALCQIVSGATDQKKNSKKNRLGNTISFNKTEDLLVNKKTLAKILLFILGISIILCGVFFTGRNGMKSIAFSEASKIDTIAPNKQDSTSVACLIDTIDSLKNEIKKNVRIIKSLKENNNRLSELNKLTNSQLKKIDSLKTNK